MNFLKSITHLAGFVAISFILIACGGGGGSSKTPANDDPVVEDPTGEASVKTNDLWRPNARTIWPAEHVFNKALLPDNWDLTCEVVSPPVLVDPDELTIAFSLRWTPNWTFVESDWQFAFEDCGRFGYTYANSIPQEGLVVNYEIPLKLAIEQECEPGDTQYSDYVWGTHTNGVMKVYVYRVRAYVTKYTEDGKIYSEQFQVQPGDGVSAPFQRPTTPWTVGYINLKEEIAKFNANN